MSQEREIVVLGAGESGVGTALLAQQKGEKVFVSDNGSIKDKYKKVLCNNDIDWEENGHDVDRILNAKEVIKSPGIPGTVKLIRDLRSNGISVISEIEYAGRFLGGAKTICITGSNGKTTTTMMIYHILQKAGLNVAMGGNVGVSFASLVAKGGYDYYVIELSSFQLDDMFDFKADIAVLLNITPDHLDRYENNMQLYADSKLRIIQNQTDQDVFIYNADDEWIMKQIEGREISSRMLPFTYGKELEEGAFVANEQLTIKINKQQATMSIHELAQQGKHSAYNSMASGIASRVLEIRKEIIRESLSDFQNVEHRLEFVAKVHGIEFVNDSKATNVNSTWYALESMQNPVIWIAGGVDKGNDYEFLSGLVKQKVVGMVCLGKDNSKLHAAFDGIVENVWDATSAQEAVGLGYRLAKKGYTVLLSPACASFDLFDNYEDRGNQFKNAVRSL